jgi:hypothetical protein
MTETFVASGYARPMQADSLPEKVYGIPIRYKNGGAPDYFWLIDFNEESLKRRLQFHRCNGVKVIGPLVAEENIQTLEGSIKAYIDGYRQRRSVSPEFRVLPQESP